MDIDARTGKPLDYGEMAQKLNTIRERYSTQGVNVHIVGFAMIEGDLIQGMKQIFLFFGISVVITTAMVFWYTRCLRSTGLVVLCSMLAVLWQLGLVAMIGFSLNPYSILVPFLIFAIGMSHGAQKMNGVMQDVGRGLNSLVAARMTFRRLFVAGVTALICDAAGFAVLLTIRIEAIRDLAVIACLGVAVLIVTNLILLPVFLSYTGVSKAAAERNLCAVGDVQGEEAKHPIWAMLDLFTQRKYASIAIVFALGLGVFGTFVARNLQIGDLAPGAPELRDNSVYNQDNAYFVSHYQNSGDVFVVMVKTPTFGCSTFDVLASVDKLEELLEGLPGVVSTSSFSDYERTMSVQLNEGSYDWYDLIPNQAALNEGVQVAPESLRDANCDFLTISVFLKDHKAKTLTDVVNNVEEFSAKNGNGNATFMMAAGDAGIEAATNLVVKTASHLMLIEVYCLVILISLITFRSWRAIVVAILPLALTSILAQALMVWLGIGVKVGTLPVTALGVGIGVDYSLYILSVTLVNLRAGLGLSEAYYRALLFTGKVVMLTGFTLAVSVATWAFSSIKFQADMGELLAFMFIWNMLGALILLPAFASFLLPEKLFSKSSDF
jgi:predicted RND superfamily exporter protein